MEIYIPGISDPCGNTIPIALSTREQTGHTLYRQTPTNRSLESWKMTQSENYESARFTSDSLEELQSIAQTYHDQSSITRTIVEVRNGVKTTTTYIVGEQDPIVVTEPTEEEDGRKESRTGKLVQSTLTSQNGGMWELQLRISEIYWDKDDEDADDEDELDEDDDEVDDEGDEIPGNSREYPLMQVSCSMEETSVLNHEKLRNIGSDERSAISALLSGASQYDQIKVGTKRYKSIAKLLDFRVDGIGHVLTFVLRNPTFQVPVTHITFSYKSSSKPDMPEAGKVVRGTAMPGQFRTMEGYVCIFVGCGYSYRKGAPIFVDSETGEDARKKYEIEENYVVFYGQEELYR